ncbi:MAG: hypothetical protein JSW34_06465 [Candidatus Zixiibacteriota bacterium]|nr:MAG: hypothetical protein JSW34_06465 [candidate division Zixibacteria bacterium]
MSGERLRRICSGDRGGALLIALAVMMMLLLAAIVAVDTAQIDMDLSFNQLHLDQAFYVAEAGLKQSVVKLNENNTWDTGYANVVFEEGIYSVAVIHSDPDSLLIDTVTIRSSGAVQKANATLEGMVVPELLYPYQYAVFGQDSVKMENNTCTDSYNSDSGSFDATTDVLGGDVASNGEVMITNSAIIGGDASSALADGVDLCPTCSVRGDLANGVDPYVVDPLPQEEFDYAHSVSAAPGGLSGSYTYDGITHELNLATNDVVTLSGGVYYFSDITLAANSQVLVAPGAKVMIYMTGDIILQNNTSINPTQPASSLIINSQGDIHTMGQSIDIQAAFYSPAADIFIGDGCDFYGSIIGASVSMDNAACIHYDRALSEYPVSVTGAMLMISWREL